MIQEMTTYFLNRMISDVNAPHLSQRYNKFLKLPTLRILSIDGDAVEQVELSSI